MTQGRWPAVHGRQRSLMSLELARRWRRPTWTTLADRTRQEGEAAAHDIEPEERRRRPGKAGRGEGCRGGRSGRGECQGLGSAAASWATATPPREHPHARSSCRNMGMAASHRHARLATAAPAGASAEEAGARPQQGGVPNCCPGPIGLGYPDGTILR